MRAEDVVGCLFFAGLLAGVALLLWARRDVGAAERKRRQGMGIAVMGGALLAFGVVTWWMVRISPRVTVEGNLWAVEQPVKGSTGFRVTDGAGRVAEVVCRYRGPGLREGERARVTYVAYNQNLVQLTMLDGPYAGWELEEPVRPWGEMFMGAIGVVCLTAGLRAQRKAAAV